MKRTLPIVLIGLFVVALVGRSWIADNARGIIGAAKEGVDDSLPVAVIEAKEDNAIKEAAEDVRHARVRLTSSARQFEKATIELESREEELGRQLDVLARSSELLDSSDASFTIANKTVSREELAEDVESRLNFVDDLRARIESQRDALEQWKAQLAAARTDVAKAESQLQQQRLEIGRLRDREKLLNAALAVQDLSAPDLAADGKNFITQRQERVDRLEDRLRTGVTPDAGLIDFTSEQDVRDRLAHTLQEGG